MTDKIDVTIEFTNEDCFIRVGSDRVAQRVNGEWVIREMKEGPSSSTIRCGSQATASCCGQKARVANVAEKAGQDPVRHGRERRA